MRDTTKDARTMKVAVTSQNFRTVTGHAGRARRFLIYDVQPHAEPVEVARLDLPQEMCMHAFHGSERHPLDDVDVILSAEFGDGFSRRMARRGVVAAVTTTTDPARAVREYAAAPAAGAEAPTLTSGCGRSHRHAHGHGHGHGHGCCTGTPSQPR
jgi:predicted Fe-Mo cluster-binding NifX family protein